MTAPAPLVERFVVGVDVEDYSGRNTGQQRTIQQDLDDLLGQAAEAAGLDRNQWTRLGGGDGELAVLPPAVDMVPVVNSLVRELNARLLRRNRDHSPGLQVRVRVAMHIDAVTPSVQGYAGPALVVLTRLLDSMPLRTALKHASRSALALVVSEPVHRMVVHSGLGDLEPDDFLAVQVDIPTKRFSQIAHLHVPGHDAHTFAWLASTEDASPSASGSSDAPPSSPSTPIPGIGAGQDMNAGGDIFIGTKTSTNRGDR